MTTAKMQTGQESSAKQKQRTPEEQLAEVERVAREHGADLSEEGFNEAIKKVAPTKRKNSQ